MIRAANQIRRWLDRHPHWADVTALGLLALLWLFACWRVITPNEAHQVSYPLGDFSGQFVAFAAYQAERLLNGQIPLWNPYNYAGHPFLADTQTAVFYPLRLLTIFTSQFTGGMTYAALQAEALAHAGLASLWTYLFARTVTRSRLAGLISAITLTYGGYLTGYPPLQLAVLEAGIWLPLALLGVYRASTVEGGKRWYPAWLGVSVLALGLSLLAGHPQTSLFLTYVLAAYFVHRAVKTRQPWLHVGLWLAVTLSLGYGLAAVQLLPGLEYTRLTVRDALGFAELSRGFPFGDLMVVLVPNVKTVWSPLYSGIAALILAGIAIVRRAESARFWGIMTVVAVVLSFGGLTILYRLLFFIAPGLSWFRGQERAAYIVAYGIATLAGVGTASLIQQPAADNRIELGLRRSAILAAGLTLLTFVLSQLNLVQEVAPFGGDTLLDGMVFLTILIVLSWVLFGRMGRHSAQAWWGVALVALVAFDVMSLSWNTNWEAIPSSQRVLTNKALVSTALEDGSLFRVDGRLGLGGNYGSMVGLQDMRGISPLRLKTLDAYYQQFLGTAVEYKLYQLLSVKYVFTDAQELQVSSQVVAADEWAGLPAHLHQLDNPTPRAWMVYQVMDTPDPNQALGWLADPGFDPTRTVILDAQPELELPGTPPEEAPRVAVTRYEPERIEISVQTPANGILVISEMDYPGWKASMDGDPARIWRADGGLRAFPLEAGAHQISLRYQPRSYRIGMIVSLTSLALVAGGYVLSWRRRGYA